MSIYDDIKNRLSIIEAFEKYTDANLPKARIKRKQFNICCPFHNDKNPSLTIYTKSNTWYCQAGCGGGDVINLVSKSLNISNREARLKLQKDLGIEIKWSPTEYTRWQEDSSIIRGFEELKNQIVSELLRLKKLFNQAMKQVASIEERDRLVDVYHFNIEKYLEELNSGDFKVQVSTIKYLKPLLLGDE